MLIVLLLFLVVETLFLTHCFNTKARSSLNPLSVMVYIWLILLCLAYFLGEKQGFYKLDFTGILSVIWFLNVITICAYMVVRWESDIQTEDNDIELISSKGIYTIALLAFALFAVGNAFYFRDLSRYIPLGSLLSSLWRWKNLVLSGTFSESSILYFGRNLSIVGTILSLNLIVNFRQKRKKLISILMALIYLALVFANPRRDPMIDKLVYFLCPLIFVYRNRASKLIKYIVPLSVIIIFLFIYISEALTFGQRSMVELAGRYTYVPFNSLQKALDEGYPSNTNLIMGNTFYFVYMILKYVFPMLAPPRIILSALGAETGNVYTSIIAPLIDSNGNPVYFVFILTLYAAYIGIVIAVSMNLIHRRKDLSSYVFYCAVFACAIRSYFNPTFSYAEVIGGILNAIVVSLLFNRVLKTRSD